MTTRSLATDTQLAVFSYFSILYAKIIIRVRQIMKTPGLPAENHLIDCQSLHGELLDLTTQFVWQTHEPISAEEYENLALPKTIVRVGLGRGVMDAHYFRRSPGAEVDGPVATREFDGHLFLHCANPPADGPQTPYGVAPKLLTVNKHHSLIFEAGRMVEVLRNEKEQDFIQVISSSPMGGGILQDKSELAPAATPLLPAGWRLRTEPIANRLTVDLPCPTEAWFFANGTSYQGPISTFGAPTSQEQGFVAL